MASWADHALALVLIVVFPLAVAVRWRAQQARIRSDPARYKVRAYRSTIATQWVLTAILAAVWFGQGRDLAPLGLTLETRPYAWAAAALTAAAIAFLVLQLRTVQRSAEAQAQVRAQTRTVAELLPDSPREMRWFAGVSITAGICEELLYRGFLLWWLTLFLPLWGAAIAAVAVFGAAHAYQGLGGALRAGAAGGVFLGLYVLSGALWLPMLLHAFVDLNGGQTAVAARAAPN